MSRNDLRFIAEKAKKLAAEMRDFNDKHTERPNESIKRESARKKAAIDCAKKLKAACESMNKFLAACNDCADGSGSEQRGISDGRIVMVGNMSEYATYLDDRYGSC